MKRDSILTLIGALILLAVSSKPVPAAENKTEPPECWKIWTLLNSNNPLRFDDGTFEYETTDLIWSAYGYEITLQAKCMRFYSIRDGKTLWQLWEDETENKFITLFYENGTSRTVRVGKNGEGFTVNVLDRSEEESNYKIKLRVAVSDQSGKTILPHREIVVNAKRIGRKIKND